MKVILRMILISEFLWHNLDFSIITPGKIRNVSILNKFFDSFNPALWLQRVELKIGIVKCIFLYE